MKPRARRDPFRTTLYDRLHDTPTQRKFRRIAPIPVGMVFQEWPGMTMADIRREFRLMRRLGFTCLKQCLVLPGTDRRQVMHMALDEGLIPWWYDEGGWEPITPALLRRLRIPARTPIAQVRADKRFLAHQQRLMRHRVDHGEPPDTGGASSTTLDGVKLAFDHTVEPAFVPHFVRWAREHYRRVDRALAAWNLPRYKGSGATSAPRTWQDLESDLPRGNYRFTRDVLRCKADFYLTGLRARVEKWKQHDPHAPFRAGGEMGLFLPFAARAADMEGIAGVMADYGSFYPSIHLGWHFEEVNFEVTRPVYMMAQLMQDWFKGGWTAAWESTGGPQQFGGAKAPFWPPAREQIAGFTVNAGVMTQLMLSYLAGGFKGFGFWCWSAPGGLGEYSVLDRQRRPTDRAVQMGRIGQAARRCRDELWQARKEPLVGVYTDFDNDAVWAATAVGGRDLFQHIPMKARVGVSRALINHNVPWEYVTSADFRSGLGGRYRVLYLPVLFAIGPDLMRRLHDYVRQGGRLVLDMPGAWQDDCGRQFSTDRGTLFEKTFGCLIRDFQYSSNVPRHLQSQRLTGCVADLAPTHARVVAKFDNDLPAVTEARVGGGTALVLGYEASLLCYQPGSGVAEQRLVEYTLGPYHSPYACAEAIVYRLAAPRADHYFLINDGPTCRATLDTREYRYRRIVDAVTQEELPAGQPIAAPAYSGRWLRYEK